jgi:hypothetical protein
LALLRELVDGLKQDKAALSAELERERAERRKERDEASEERRRYIDMLEKAHLQLAAFRPEPPAPPPQASPPPRGFWARLTGRG